MLYKRGKSEYCFPKLCVAVSVSFNNQGAILFTPPIDKLLYMRSGTLCPEAKVCINAPLKGGIFALFIKI